MNIGIVTDSTCDLPLQIAQEADITIMPLYVNIEEKSYLDGLELSHEEFYRRLVDCSRAPTTSAPAPGRFAQIYQHLAKNNIKHIFSIHISHSLSNTVNVAHMAAQEVQGVEVTVFDSGQISLGTGLMALAASQAAAAGKSVDQITNLLESLRRRTHTFAALDTLEFVRRSGRLSRFAYGLGTLLDIKPILKMHDGIPSMEKVRTDRRAANRLIDLVTELGALEELAVVHTASPEKVTTLMERAAGLLDQNPARVIGSVTPAIGAHIGPGVFGFVCIKRT